MTTSSQGRAQITLFEGCKLQTYKDTAGVQTIGVGHTGPDVLLGLVITPQMADELLSKDLVLAETCVNRAVKVPLSQAQFDMLVSFAFNVGCGSLQQSTLLKLLNQGDYMGAANQFLAWDKMGKPKQVSPGLTKRRVTERDIFLNGYNEAA